jgi:hypothetical protein
MIENYFDWIHAYAFTNFPQVCRPEAGFPLLFQ